MKRTALATTDLEVPAVSFGTAPLGQLFGPVPLSDGVGAVHEAIDLGITLLDTSPYDGDAEERLRIALQGRRDDALISTKAGRYPGKMFDFSPTRIRNSLHESLRRLRTDHVDVLFLHDIDFVDVDVIIAESIAPRRSAGRRKSAASSERAGTVSALPGESSRRRMSTWC